MLHYKKNIIKIDIDNLPRSNPIPIPPKTLLSPKQKTRTIKPLIENKITQKNRHIPNK